MTDVPVHKFLSRFLMATFSAFVLVYLCALTLSPSGYGSGPLDLLFLAGVVLLFSIPGGAISAAIAKRSEFKLVLIAQALTIALLTALTYLQIYLRHLPTSGFD